MRVVCQPCSVSSCSACGCVSLRLYVFLCIFNVCVKVDCCLLCAACYFVFGVGCAGLRLLLMVVVALLLPFLLLLLFGST